MITKDQRSQLASMVTPPGLAPLRLGPTQRPWWLLDGTSHRPGIGLTPQRILAAFRQAEIGNPIVQCDMFEDVLENDGHMRGQYESRLESVAFRPWLVRAGGKDQASIDAASYLYRALRRTNMPLLLWHLMDAIGFGYSGANIVWNFDPKARAVVPVWFLLAPHRRWMVDTDTSGLGTGQLRFRTEANQDPGIIPERGEWIIASRPHRLAVRAGAFRTTTWWAYFKRMSITDWIVYAEKFGIPLVLGYYADNASPESRAALMQAITDIGSDGQAVLSDLTKIVINEAFQTRSGDVGSLHPKIAAVCDAEISKVITGATLNVESGGPGSFALGKVHEGRAHQKTMADAFWLQQIFQECVVQPYLDYNPQFANAEPPQLIVRVRPDMSPETAVRVYHKLQAMGLEIEDEQMYEEFGLRRPEVGSTLKPLYAEAAPTAPTSDTV